ncbi:MAG: hypothetical protein JO307_32450, partial [Bryobacterales bacterium]|nr:hypothetical protein [Bryobacterales bacterium]
MSFGSEQHARYLVIQAPAGNTAFRSYDRSLGARAHMEDAHAAAFTQVGAEAATGGPLAPDMIQGADVAWEGRSESADIDELMLAPFHRLSLLAPWAQTGGYGSFGAFPRRAAALALRGPIDALRIRRLVEFPPAGSEIFTNAMGGSEWPNPIAGCSGYEPPLGIPVTLQTGRRLTLYSYGLRDLSTNQSVAICGFDATRYTNSNA